jgi:hypothetical protein
MEYLVMAVVQNLDFRLLPRNEYCFFGFRFLHSVCDEFTDNVSETAVC